MNHQKRGDLPPRQMALAGFMLSGPVVHSHAVWRHPQTRSHFLDPDYYLEVARTLEDSCFDLLFFADRLAVGDQAGQSRARSFELGSQDATRLDPLPILSLLAGHTKHIGLGLTRSTTYYQPPHVARAIATLDHLSRGRSAWNIVTSMNDSEARLFGHQRHLAHAQRYARADEFVELVLKLWNSWQPDALVLDKANGILANPQRIDTFTHRGDFFSCEGPLNIPRVPQGQPVLIQAGASGRGQQFGARWAEVIFSINSRVERMLEFRQDIHHQMRSFGRDPQDCKILTAVMPFIGGTEAEAARKRDEHNALAAPELGLITLSTQSNFDFTQFPLDMRLHEIAALPDTPDVVAQKLRLEANVSLEQYGAVMASSIRVPQLAGTAETVAQQLIDWLEQGACDGYVVSPAYLPGTFTEFAESVVPILQRRGYLRTAYEHSTLRGHLGLKEFA